MGGLYYYDGSFGFEVFHEELGDLAGEALLYLEATGVIVEYPGQFAYADHAAIGQIRDVGLADKRHHVVLADAVERDVP